MRLLPITIACLALAASASAAPAPRLSITSIGQIEVPATPFDETANADAAVDAAIARAKASHKRVLIDLGGNWCADCRILSGLMELPEMRSFLAAHYEIVDVDVGRFNRNLQIPARYGITQKLEGVPAILVVTPDGRLVNAGKVSAIEDARHMTPQALADWLAQWST